ncbi:FUSC family protein [Gordonia sp. OPL2]|uniref:FUSC family protein n=1 Tax=Gordonia sp. OPL2 TaxID=2486274 RepID=UPI001654E224|nr:FUSC family protein [Gordonia sp. OPL2]RPA10185.1 FUSC family protein [Gordonia sp. OPL2]
MSTTVVEHVRHRRGALAHAVSPHAWRSTMAVDMSRASVGVPIRVGIAVGFVLVVGGLVGARDVAGFAALGALVSAFCRPDPYPVRVGRLAALGIGIVASVLIGSVLGVTHASPTIEVTTIALWGAVAALLIGTLRVAGPGAVVFVFAANGAMGFAADLSDLSRAAVASLLGAVCGAVASLSPWLVRGAWNRIRGRVDDALDAGSATVRYESIWTTLGRRPHHALLVNAARIAAAIAASAAIAMAVGLSHPMWAAMGAMAAMQGVSYHITVQRGLQRLLGNIAGAVVAAALLGLGLGYWGAVVAIVACQIAAEIWAPVNYAIASTAVTPMALLMTALSAGLTPEAAIDRVVDTLIGIVVGIVIAAVTITGSELRTAAD